MHKRRIWGYILRQYIDGTSAPCGRALDLCDYAQSLTAEGVNLAREFPQWIFADYAFQEFKSH